MTSDQQALIDGAYFDAQSLEIDLQFFSSLTLTKSTRSGGPEPFVLLPPHKKFFSNLLGWRRADGSRLIRRAFFSSARKQSKSTGLAAPLALYMLVMDGEISPEIYCLGLTSDQASVVFDACVAFINNHPELRQILKVVPYSKTIINPLNGGKIKCLSGEGKQQHGKNASCVIFDELAVWGPGQQELFDSMTTSSKARKSPLFLFITTAGVEEHSICGRQYNYACRVRDGLVDDPTYLPMIYELAKGDQWWDEKNWIKANPCIGTIIDIQSLREERDVALNSPTDALAFQRLTCNLWVNSAATWIPTAKWDKCRFQGTDKEFFEFVRPHPAYGGLDLSGTTDITSLSLVWPIGDKVYVHSWPFLPSEGIVEKSKADGVPYYEWSTTGQLELCYGPVIDARHIIARIGELSKQFKIVEIGFDSWGSPQIVTEIMENGLKCFDVSQGLPSLTAPSKYFEQLVLTQKISHTGSPLVRWCLDCCTIWSDSNGNIKVVKPDLKKSTKRIDPIISTINALSRLQKAKPVFRSVYATRGILSVGPEPKKPQQPVK